MTSLEIIKQDLYRYRPCPYSWRQLILGFRSQGFKYIYLMRKCKGTSIFPLGWIYRLLLRHYRNKYGFQISPATEIGGGFYIGHFGTIIVNNRARIGKNCNIAPGVTIGKDHRGNRKGVPTLGDNVWIGTNSVIVGNILIGNDVLIVPNAFVNFNVPDHSIVIGNPARIIPRDYATEGYINNTLN